MDTTNSAPGLTAFQNECRHALETLLSNRQTAASFEVVYGNRENYVVARLAHTDEGLEVFIYEDEAGISLGKSWYPFESVDFNSDADLIEKLSQHLEHILAVPGI